MFSFCRSEVPALTPVPSPSALWLVTLLTSPLTPTLESLVQHVLLTGRPFLYISSLYGLKMVWAEPVTLRSVLYDNYIPKHGYLFYVQVIVTVDDENDVTPTFPLYSYTYCIKESSAISTTLEPYARATDADVGSNGIIEYFLQSSSTHPFRVDQSSGVVSLDGELDRETKPSYTLILEAVDQGSPSKTGTTELRSVCLLYS